MSEENETELDELAPRIEDALMLSGMSATKFGYMYFGDSAFIKKMREGRKFYSKTRTKIVGILKDLGVSVETA